MKKIEKLENNEKSNHGLFRVSINQLQQFINASQYNSFLLDKSPQSLHYLWEWFENIMEWEEVSETVLRQRLEGRPEWMHEEILSHRWEETVQT